MSEQKPRLSRFSIRKVCQMCNGDEDKVIYCAHCNNTGLEPEQHDTNVVLSDLEKPVKGEEIFDILDGAEDATEPTQFEDYVDTIISRRKASGLYEDDCVTLKQTKLSVEEAADKWFELMEAEGKGYNRHDIFFAAHALASSNMVELERVEQCIKDYYNSLHSWEEANPLVLINQIKQLNK